MHPQSLLQAVIVRRMRQRYQVRDAENYMNHEEYKLTAKRTCVDPQSGAITRADPFA
jgi:hypothetical protein